MKKHNSIKSNGLPASTLIVPLAAVMVALFVAIVVLIVGVKHATNDLNDLMIKSGSYQAETTELQTGASVMTETAGTFVQLPVVGNGKLNIEPLKVYANELRNDRRGPDVAKRLREAGVGQTAQEYIDKASEYAELMKEEQLHAIALIRSVYPFPDDPALSSIPERPLTEEETAMSDEQRLENARMMLLGREYSKSRSFLSESITNCNKAMQQDFDRIANEKTERLKALRTLLWIVMFFVILAMIGAFVFFFTWLVLPLRSYARLITSDQSLEKRGGVRELRLLVTAYNGLLGRRNKLEEILRAAAETDALTGMPNRYSMECSILENAEIGGSMAVLFFDVNYLKHVNDNEGHSAGDKLLRAAGVCICECFADGDGGNCFRIGGDEFAAILRGCSEDEVKERIGRFSRALKRENVSVSVGYGYTESADENSFKALMTAADKMMYDEKKRFHEQQK